MYEQRAFNVPAWVRKSLPMSFMPNADITNLKDHITLNEVASNHVVSSDIFSEPEQEPYFDFGADAIVRRQLSYFLEDETQTHPGCV
jgi:hypothetical protein